jgi:MOB kinase activator 1
VLRVVELPSGSTEEDWCIINSVDFFNDVSALWGIVCEEEQDENSSSILNQGIGQGFPPGFEYRFPSEKNGSPKRMSANRYIDSVLSWIEERINRDPLLDGRSPKTQKLKATEFNSIVNKIFTRIFRIYAILYSKHFSQLQRLEIQQHVDASFKNFIFFCFEFDIIQEREFEAIQEIVKELKDEFIA